MMPVPTAIALIEVELRSERRKTSLIVDVLAAGAAVIAFTFLMLVMAVTLLHGCANRCFAAILGCVLLAKGVR